SICSMLSVPSVWGRQTSACAPNSSSISDRIATFFQFRLSRSAFSLAVSCTAFSQRTTRPSIPIKTRTNPSANPSSCFLNTKLLSTTGEATANWSTSRNARRISANIFCRIDCVLPILSSSFPLLAEIFLGEYGQRTVFAPNTSHRQRKHFIFHVPTSCIHQLTAQHYPFPSPNGQTLQLTVQAILDRLLPIVQQEVMQRDTHGAHSRAATTQRRCIAQVFMVFQPAQVRHDDRANGPAVSGIICMSPNVLIDRAGIETRPAPYTI